jgi:hypothetical protein
MTTVLGAILVSGVSACGNSSAEAAVASPRAAAAPPTVDSATQMYVDFANSFWNDHVTAEGNAAAVCLGTGLGTQGINPPLCRLRGVSMLAVQEKFLSDLDVSPPPARFAAEDRVLRPQLPKTVADLKAMISAADVGNKQGILDAANAYVDDMGLVLGALDQINPSVTHI